MMQIGVQRRHIYLAPPAGLELHWLARLFDKPEIYTTFGHQQPAAQSMSAQLVGGYVISGTIRLVVNQARIGFVLMFPPGNSAPFWEFGYAITSPNHRDAYGAMHAMDAMAYYTLEYLKMPVVGGRTLDGNRQADAIVRRLGYQQQFDRMLDGLHFRFYTLDQAGWQRRKSRLEAGEAKVPSAGGAAFVPLTMQPVVPVIIHREALEDAADGRREPG